MSDVERPGSPGWWVSKARRFRSHVLARVGAAEHAALGAWLSPAQRALFDAMHVADRRHGLDVVAALRLAGVTEPDALVAGLLHDAGKGNAGVVARIFHSLEQAYGPLVPATVRRRPAMAGVLDRLAHHAERSATLAAGAGCSPRTVDLIRWQDAPRDPEFGEILRFADEAN